jgi:hypothetical protein
LVALIASMSATGAFANIPRVHQEGVGQDFSARIVSVVTSIDQKGAARLRDVLHVEMKVAQWRN